METHCRNFFYSKLQQNDLVKPGHSPLEPASIINPLKACDQCRLRSREGDGFTKKAQNDAFRTPNSKRRTRIHPSSTEPTCFVPFQHNFPMEPPPGRLYSAKSSPRACGVRFSRFSHPILR